VGLRERRVFPIRQGGCVGIREGGGVGFSEKKEGKGATPLADAEVVLRNVPSLGAPHEPRHVLVVDLGASSRACSLPLCSPGRGRVAARRRHSAPVAAARGHRACCSVGAPRGCAAAAAPAPRARARGLVAGRLEVVHRATAPWSWLRKAHLCFAGHFGSLTYNKTSLNSTQFVVVHSRQPLHSSRWLLGQRCAGV